MHYKKRKLHKLHSIPIGLCNKVNHNRLYLVSYSIPLSLLVVLLLGLGLMINPGLFLADKSSAVTIQDEWVVKKNSSSSSYSAGVEDENDSGSNTVENADSIDDSFGGFGGDEVELSQEDTDAGISLQSVVTAPTLAITVSNSNQTIDAVQGGNTVYGSYNVGITGSNVKDYTLSIKADAVNLVSPSQASTPTPVAGAGGKTGNSMDANTWGYKLTETSTNESSYGTLSYASLPTSLTQIANGTVSSPYNLSTNKKLIFAAKFSDTAAPGTYKGHITLSAVANQAVVSAIWSSGVDSGITDMQDVSSGFCKNNSKIAEGDTITLKDSRDGNNYKVVKLRDGNCWMQENLRLTGDRVLKSSDSNVSNDWDMPKTLVNSATSVSGWGNDVNQPYSAFFTDARYDNYGIYYSWCAATAGTCLNTISGTPTNVSDSICSKGWHLPTGGGVDDNGTGEFGVFNGLSTSVITVLPYNFVTAGYINEFGYIWSPGSRGNYWSSTGYPSRADHLYFDDSSFNPGTASSSRYVGYSVRCVANY